jgi:DNA-binding HxlR family transcriptional regulator
VVLNREYEMSCSIARTLEVVGERWTLLVIRDILLGRRRFGEIQDSLGIARNVLSDRLTRLEEEGIVERRIYQERPPRHEYLLTDKGLDLWPVLVSMLDWGNRHNAAPEGPPMAITHKDCGGIVDGRGYCTECGERLTAREADVVGGRRARELTAAALAS